MQASLILSSGAVALLLSAATVVYSCQLLNAIERIEQKFPPAFKSVEGHGTSAVERQSEETNRNANADVKRLPGCL